MKTKSVCYSLLIVVVFLLSVVSCNKGGSAEKAAISTGTVDSLEDTIWVNQDGNLSFSFIDKSQVVITISGSAIPSIYSLIDNTVTITAMSDSVTGKIEGNKITITGELLEGEILIKK